MYREYHVINISNRSTVTTMFVYYNRQDCEDGTIVLTPNHLDLSDYTATINSNGNITLQRREIVVNVLVPECNTSFTGSTVHICRINDFPRALHTFNGVLREVYNIISCGMTIVKNTKLNITTLQRNDKGFFALPDIGISVQRVDANKCIQEIVHQCKMSGISLLLEVKLADDRIAIVRS